MNEEQAIDAFAALGHPRRLAIYRFLMAVAPGEAPAGEVARALSIPASTLSSHLAQLERAKLICSRRDSRHIFYSIDESGSAGLVSFLTEECCKGRPDLCGHTSRRRIGSRRREPRAVKFRF